MFDNAPRLNCLLVTLKSQKKQQKKHSSSKIFTYVFTLAGKTLFLYRGKDFFLASSILSSSSVAPRGTFVCAMPVLPGPM